VKTLMFTTERLFIKPLEISHHHFIQALVKADGWLKFKMAFTLEFLRPPFQKM